MGPLKAFLSLFLLIASLGAEAKSLSVHVFYWSNRIEAQVAMRRGFEEEIKKYNESAKQIIQLIPHVAGEGHLGVMNQIHQMENAIDLNPDALIVQPADISTVSRATQDAALKKIPVFTFDQFVLNGKVASYVASDNYQAGWNNGIYVESLFPKNHEIKIVIFEYTRVSAVINRIDGFFDALRSRKRKFVVLKRYEAIDPLAAGDAVNSMMKEFPKKRSIDLIFSVNDGGGNTVVEKLWNKGRREVIHASIDGDPVAVTNIKERRLTVIDSAQYCAEMGREIARQLIAHFSGTPVTPKVLIPTFPVTRETVSEFKGWLALPAPPPKSFPDPRASGSQQIQGDYGGATVRIGMAAHCPYLCDRGADVWSGYVFDILKDMAQKNNFKLKIVNTKNDELAKALKAKKIDFAVMPSYLVRYQPGYQIARSKLGVSYTGALFTPGIKMRVVDKNSLENLRVAFANLGQENDFSLDPEEFKKSIKLEGVDVAEKVIKVIGERRVDVALGDYNVIRYTQQRRQLLSLELQATSLTGFNTLSLVAAESPPAFADHPLRLQVWLAQARKSDQLQKILTKYNLKDWSDFEY
ncbi:substrate-binding domain-containing protein [Bdellovibrio sp. SKB1291214]|uniref:substrate-binding domain-containing protein n=1 Tax=Bdellovibrio sp. SKB1291214 TaxID=1732569 RepID=UPI000B670035|nr:substrate-binding domain-containing protein [Bdellovibrio sp. SKB1291214]UYL07295.1 substrate-binding domain-containing protein [Bdellovibrio sp. SKB1291214]